MVDEGEHHHDDADRPREDRRAGHPDLPRLDPGLTSADGETRTLTDGDLNAVPLPIGLRRRRQSCASVDCTAATVPCCGAFGREAGRRADRLGRGRRYGHRHALPGDAVARLPRSGRGAVADAVPGAGDGTGRGHARSSGGGARWRSRLRRSASAASCWHGLSPSRRTRRAVAGGASTGLRIASLNLLYTNDESNIAAVADDLRAPRSRRDRVRRVHGRARARPARQ